jgi:hypothetical protein
VTPKCFKIVLISLLEWVLQNRGQSLHLEKSKERCLEKSKEWCNLRSGPPNSTTEPNHCHRTETDRTSTSCFSYDFGVTVVRHQNVDAMVLATALMRDIHPLIIFTGYTQCPCWTRTKAEKLTQLTKFVDVSVFGCSNADWIALVMNASVVVRSFSPACICSCVRLVHIKVLVTPTFAIHLDTEVSVAFVLCRFSTAVIRTVLN